IDVAASFDVPHFGVGGALRVDGERVRDAARNRILAAGLQVGVRGQFRSFAARGSRCVRPTPMAAEAFCPIPGAQSAGLGTIPAVFARSSARMRLRPGPSTISEFELAHFGLTETTRVDSRYCRERPCRG